MHRSRRPTLIALLVLAPALACPSVDGGEEDVAERIELRDAELGDLASVSVCDDVWLTEAPGPEHLDIAARRGIRTVVSLLPEELPRELEAGETCRELGMAFVPIDAEAVPTNENVDEVIAALDRRGRGATLLYCESGARSVMVFTVYRVLRLGVPLEQALDDARRAGMKPGESEAFVRKQVDRLSV